MPRPAPSFTSLTIIASARCRQRHCRVLEGTRQCPGLNYLTTVRVFFADEEPTKSDVRP